ncbi:hypothetical protein GCM10023113_10230 [Cellulomonas oligotrophica]|nr:hypothetical protein Col01nite_02970 [Cellulomonas oligotrophica]
MGDRSIRRERALLLVQTRARFATTALLLIAAAACAVRMVLGVESPPEAPVTSVALFTFTILWGHWQRQAGLDRAAPRAAQPAGPGGTTPGG